jgi:hypothetical protein
LAVLTVLFELVEVRINDPDIITIGHYSMTRSGIVVIARRPDMLERNPSRSALRSKETS